jgi:hypothetical protein
MVRTLATTVSTDVLVVTVVLVETVVPQEARAGLLVMVATVVLALLVVLVATGPTATHRFRLLALMRHPYRLSMVVTVVLALMVVSVVLVDMPVAKELLAVTAVMPELRALVVLVEMDRRLC